MQKIFCINFIIYLTNYIQNSTVEHETEDVRLFITKETDYALRILRVLADEERATATELAQGEQIPQQFAYKILKKLQKGGMDRIRDRFGTDAIQFGTLTHSEEESEE